jgi:hypothetical protein
VFDLLGWLLPLSLREPAESKCEAIHSQPVNLKLFLPPQKKRRMKVVAWPPREKEPARAGSSKRVAHGEPHLRSAYCNQYAFSSLGSALRLMEDYTLVLNRLDRKKF